MKAKPKTVDEYIAGFPTEIQNILQEIRSTIKKAVPEAEEKIAYDMPTFVLNGNLITYAAWKKHIGMYPVPTSLSAELAEFKQEKSSIHFPLDKPMPLELIARIATHRIDEMPKRTSTKAKK